MDGKQSTIPAVVALPRIDLLRNWVRDTLCAHARLDPSQTVVYEGQVRRSGRCCGLFFQVEGTRAVRAYAVWAGEEHRILCYDGSGARFADVRLSESPEPRDPDGMKGHPIS